MKPIIEGESELDRKARIKAERESLLKERHANEYYQQLFGYTDKEMQKKINSSYLKISPANCERKLDFIQDFFGCTRAKAIQLAKNNNALITSTSNIIVDTCEDVKKCFDCNDERAKDFLLRNIRKVSTDRSDLFAIVDLYEKTLGCPHEIAQYKIFSNSRICHLSEEGFLSAVNNLREMGLSDSFISANPFVITAQRSTVKIKLMYAIINGIPLSNKGVLINSFPTTYARAELIKDHEPVNPRFNKLNMNSNAFAKNMNVDVERLPEIYPVTEDIVLDIQQTYNDRCSTYGFKPCELTESEVSAVVRPESKTQAYDGAPTIQSKDSTEGGDDE